MLTFSYGLLGCHRVIEKNNSLGFETEFRIALFQKD